MNERTDRVWYEVGKVQYDTCKQREALEASKAGNKCWGFKESEEEVGMRLGFTVVRRAIRKG